VLTQWDRLFWVGPSNVWSSWRNALVFAQQDTVVRWQRERFRRFWAWHLKLTLTKYFRYYHRSRPHLALDKQGPVERQIMKSGVIVEIPALGGLHHRYERVAT